MRLIDYLSEHRGRAADLARATGLQYAFISQIANESRPAPLARCMAIETATDRAVMRWDLRPADWHLVWPELVGAEGAPAISPTQQEAA